MNQEVSLINLPVGIEAVVKNIQGGLNVKNRLKVLGIRTGVKIKKISGGFARGPVVIKIGASQTALGFGVSSKIVVEVRE